MYGIKIKIKVKLSNFLNSEFQEDLIKGVWWMP